MTDKRMKTTLENIARRAVPEDINLMPDIAAQLQRRTFMSILRARPVLAVLLVLLALVLLSGVAYAIGKMNGYIPGVGIVDQTVPLRILSEPAIVEREGITVKVNQLVASAENTFVAYAYDGVFMPRNGPAMCSAMPTLQLPDGSTLNLLGGGTGGYGGEADTLIRYETSATYSPIPAGVDQVIFALDCVLPEGTGPKDWRIPLKLVRAPENYATPAVELDARFVASGPKFDAPPTPTLETYLTPAQYDPSFPNTPTPVPNGSGLYLEQVIELPNSYILVGNFKDIGDMPGYMLTTDSAYDYLPRIEDAEGNPVEFKVRDDIKPAVNWGSTYYWAYEIEKPVKGPLMITLDEIDVMTDDTIQFDFDAGPNPQPGQKWQLNLPIHLGNYDYVIDSAEMLENGYLFRWHSRIDVPSGTSFQLDIVGSSQERGSSAGTEDHRPKDKITYSQTITYLVPPPTGKLTVDLTLGETVPLKGPWTLTWTPPTQ
jgi:hypothetical protein